MYWRCLCCMTNCHHKAATQPEFHLTPLKTPQKGYCKSTLQLTKWLVEKVVPIVNRSVDLLTVEGAFLGQSKYPIFTGPRHGSLYDKWDTCVYSNIYYFFFFTFPLSFFKSFKIYRKVNYLCTLIFSTVSYDKFHIFCLYQFVDYVPQITRW